jgi:hypothetical protein
LPSDQVAQLRNAHDDAVANPPRPDQRAAFEAALARAQGTIGSRHLIGEAFLPALIPNGGAFAPCRGSAGAGATGHPAHFALDQQTGSPTGLPD